MLKLSFQKQVFLGFAISLVLVFTVNYLSFKSTNNLTQNTKLVNHTQSVINRGYEVYMLMLTAESSQRGYVITADERYLEPYHNCIERINDSISQLSKLVEDNPQQVKVLDSMQLYATQKINEMSYVIRLRKEQGLDAAIARVNTDKGRLLMTSLRDQLKKLRDEEMRLLNIRETETNSSTLRTYIVIISGGVLVLAILMLMFIYITKTFRMQREAEELIKNTNKELEAISNDNVRKNWMLTGSANINEKMRGDLSVRDLTDNIIKTLASYLDARMGAFYLYNTDINELVLRGTYAYGTHHSQVKNIKPGEGLVGQSVLDKSIIVYDNIPADYVKIQSGLGNATPTNILIAPVYSGSRMQGVIELGFSNSVSQTTLDFIELVNENIAIAIQSAKAREIMQQQAEELQTQQEELQQTNEELSSQANLLQASEEELRVQQEELQQTNVELEEKAAQLEEKNQAVEEARNILVQKAAELEQTNKYKSEFLANMSHELRTPLNSILILAKLLSENKNNTLLENEMKFATVIYNSGNDLLTLINDILDLSKIESGKLDMNFEDAAIDEITDDMRNMFNHVAENKKVNFSVQVDSNVPAVIHTDKQRLEQVLRNLLSNAFKFTPQGGSIKLNLGVIDDRLHLAVIDSGIGIPPEKQQLIFEAFQQADGTTSRKYGGTGLGLSISRELASLLGGEITLYSKSREGSTFTLIIPVKYVESAQETHNKTRVAAQPAALNTVTGVENAASNQILIIEDDVNFANVLKDYAEGKGFTALIAHDGAQGLEMARQNKPRAILLDVMMPVMNGWEVLNKLKEDPELRNIPVHIMSANESYGAEATLNGALSFVEKPVSATRLEQLFLSVGLAFDGNTSLVKTVLIIEDNELESNQLATLMKEQKMNVAQAYTGKEGLDKLGTGNYDFVILDLKLPDMDGLDVLREIKSQDKLRALPVFINTAMDIPTHIQSEIMRYSNAFVVKNKRSNERLMDEIRLFVNQIKTGEKPVPVTTIKSNASPNTPNISNSLKGKKVLLADDDMRNVFALSSILQQYDLTVEIAGNGAEALEKLKAAPDTDIVLMDIMMPEMDGYEAMRRIRALPQFKKIPMIALTAKAMKDDREKCMEAGASDYLPKPVDTDKLLSLMRVWMSK